MADRALGNPLGNPLGLARIAQAPTQQAMIGTTAIVSIYGREEGGQTSGVFTIPAGYQGFRIVAVGAGSTGGPTWGGSAGAVAIKSGLLNGEPLTISYDVAGRTIVPTDGSSLSGGATSVFLPVATMVANGGSPGGEYVAPIAAASTGGDLNYSGVIGGRSGPGLSSATGPGSGAGYNASANLGGGAGYAGGIGGGAGATAGGNSTAPFSGFDAGSSTAISGATPNRGRPDTGIQSGHGGRGGGGGGGGAGIYRTPGDGGAGLVRIEFW